MSCAYTAFKTITVPEKKKLKVTQKSAVQLWTTKRVRDEERKINCAKEREKERENMT